FTPVYSDQVRSHPIRCYARLGDAGDPSPVGTYKRSYRNTVEIAENSENHLKAIVCGRQVAGRDGFRQRAGKRGKKATGRRKNDKGPVSRLALSAAECQLHRLAGAASISLGADAKM